MESIKQIKQEFNPSILKPENENELKELWNVEAATTAAPGQEANIILTPAVIETYWNGEDVPQLQKAIDDLTEYYNMDYFRYNDYLLVDSDIKVYLTSYYRRDNWKDNLRLETNPNYNILLEKLPGDADDYFKVSEEYNNYYYHVEDEALDFLTWEILTSNADGDNFKTELQDKDITQAIAAQDKQDQEIIRTANYKELYQDIKEAYNKLLKNYIQEAQEALNLNFYEDVYLENQNAAEAHIINEYLNTPIKNII